MLNTSLKKKKLAKDIFFGERINLGAEEKFKRIVTKKKNKKQKTKNKKNHPVLYVIM